MSPFCILIHSPELLVAYTRDTHTNRKNYSKYRQPTLYDVGIWDFLGKSFGSPCRLKCTTVDDINTHSKEHTIIPLV